VPIVTTSGGKREKRLYDMTFSHTLNDRSSFIRITIDFCLLNFGTYKADKSVDTVNKAKSI